LITILAIIFLLGILVFVHELGHFIAARLCNIQVDKFSFGFGPKLFGKKIGETEYRVSLIPLGGYVKMLGENPDEQQQETIDSERSYSNKKWWQKVFVAFNGPFFNFLFAILILSLSYIIGIKTYDLKPIIGNITSERPALQQLKSGDEIIKIDGNEIDGWMSIIEEWKDTPAEAGGKVHTIELIRDGQIQKFKVGNFDYKLWLKDIEVYSPPIISDVYYGFPAYEAGLKQNDRIVKIAGKPIETWSDMRNIVQKKPEKELEFTIKRGDEKLTLFVTPRLNPQSEEKVGIIGIQPILNMAKVERYNIFESFKLGTLSTFVIIGSYYKGFYELLKNPSQVGETIGGPLMIAALTKQQTEQGISSYLSFLALISLILMIMNLLPIPILDGGQICFSIIEGIRGEPLKISVQAFLQRVGIAIILMIMFFAFYNDISRFVKRKISVQNSRESIEIVE